MDFSQAASVISLNRRIISIMGLWPSNINDCVFIFFFSYLFLQCCLEYTELIYYIDNLEFVISNLTENVILTMTLVKLGVYRTKAKQLHQILMDIKQDYMEDNYKTLDERLAFTKYVGLANRFIKTLVPLTFLTAILYYLRPLTGQLVTSDIRNSSTMYVLPYRIHLFFEITELRTYILIYVCQIPVVPIIIFGYLGTDCLLITLTFHVCGLFSVVALQVKNIITDYHGYTHGFAHLIDKHLRAIRLAKAVDETFNMLLLPQLMGISIILCIVGFNVTVNTQDGQQAHLITHVLYAICLIIVLFEYCLIGECLISESLNVGNAFYNCNWFDVPPKSLRLFLICMSRAQNPMVMTAGKIHVLSFHSFTEIMKTSMAYLSMLRKFV